MCGECLAIQTSSSYNRSMISRGWQLAAAVAAVCAAGCSSATPAAPTSPPPASSSGQSLPSLVIALDTDVIAVEMPLGITITTTDTSASGTLVIDFGDGSKDASVTVKPGVSASAFLHTYNVRGDYTISASLQDDSGAHAAVSTGITVD